MAGVSSLSFTCFLVCCFNARYPVSLRLFHYFPLLLARFLSNCTLFSFTVVNCSALFSLHATSRLSFYTLSRPIPWSLVSGLLSRTSSLSQRFLYYKLPCIDEPIQIKIKFDMCNHLACYNTLVYQRQQYPRDMTGSTNSANIHHEYVSHASLT